MLLPDELSADTNLAAGFRIAATCYVFDNDIVCGCGSVFSFCHKIIAYASEDAMEDTQVQGPIC